MSCETVYNTVNIAQLLSILYMDVHVMLFVDILVNQPVVEPSVYPVDQGIREQNEGALILPNLYKYLTSLAAVIASQINE